MGQSYARECSVKKPHPRLRVLQALDQPMGYRNHKHGVEIKLMEGETYCDFLKRLFSIPVWFMRIRATATTRSEGVRNQAVVGLSGNKNLK